MASSQNIAKSKRRFSTIWGELEYVCAKIHHWWYVKKNKSAAKRYVSRLQRILDELPETDMAILREEGLAMLYELKGQLSDAIKHRKREIMLMGKLHEDVESKGYSKRMKAAILINRDSNALRKRQAILETLEKQKTQNGRL